MSNTRKERSTRAYRSSPLTFLALLQTEAEIEAIEASWYSLHQRLIQIKHIEFEDETIYSGLEEIFCSIFRRYHSRKKAEAHARSSDRRQNLRKIGKITRKLLDEVAKCDAHARGQLGYELLKKSNSSHDNPHLEFNSIMTQIECINKFSLFLSDVEYASGPRKKNHIFELCKGSVQLYSVATGRKFGKTITYIPKNDQFDTPQAQFIYEVAKAIDPAITGSELQTALKNMPAVSKSGN